MIPKSLSTIIILVIILVWAANFFAQFVIAGYHSDPAINGFFGTIVVSVLVPKLFAKPGEVDEKNKAVDHN